jgi:hypothetical protein
MLPIIKQLLTNQFEASLSTLGLCVDRCPETAWDSRVGNLMFCQLAFHTLFYTDFYLGPNEESFRKQPFHRARGEFFCDYEELEDRPQVLRYDQAAVREYVQHCRGKAISVIADETDESLQAPCGFPRRNMSRAELYVYSVRHIQHHAAQLSLRLRLDHRENIPWVESGWRAM